MPNKTLSELFFNIPQDWYIIPIQIEFFKHFVVFCIIFHPPQ